MILSPGVSLLEENNNSPQRECGWDVQEGLGDVPGDKTAPRQAEADRQ